MRACFNSMNEQERDKFRLELIDLLKGFENLKVRPELQRILEGVQSNDPYIVLKQKHKKEFDKNKKLFMQYLEQGIQEKEL